MGRILDQHGRPYATKKPRSLSHDMEAVYDAAQTTDANARHWQYADNLSADSINSPSVRQTLRNRARYETRNNSYASGMVRTLAEDTVGTGPRLQVRTASRKANKRIEAAFAKWTKSIRLAQKLRTIRRARAVDGESFALLTTNLGLRGDVKLDVRLVEAEQVATPGLVYATAGAVDGIRFDPWGNPSEYDVLNRHPGSDLAFLDVKPKPWAAESVLHYFRPDRAGQHRGIPEIQPALPLFALLRRFTIATINAAEFAAAQSGVMYTDAPALSDDDIDDVTAMQAIEYELRALLTLPKGWKLGQIKAEHPATTHKMFRDAILEEIARCLNMPFNVAAANSSGYNYASGRLDHQVYDKSIAVERDDIESLILDVIFAAWLDEALLVRGLLPADAGPLSGWTHEWHWDARGHVDPLKEANAQIQKLAHGLTDYGAAYASEGRDYEEAHERQAQALGLTIEEYRAALVQKLHGVAATAMEEEPEPDDEAEQEVSAIARIVARARQSGADPHELARVVALAFAT